MAKSNLNLQEIHTFAAELLYDAGSFLLRQAQSRTKSTAVALDIHVKENSADLVTQVGSLCG